MYDLIIIGGGPAGISAAIQASRFGLKTLLFEKDRLGGQVNIANLIENFPGSPPLPGKKFIKPWIDKLKSTDVEIIFDEVVGIDKNLKLSKNVSSSGLRAHRSLGEVGTRGSILTLDSLVKPENDKKGNDKCFIVCTTNEKVYISKLIIIATGAVPKKLDIPNALYYADPDLIDHKGKSVVIIGGGDAAFDQALNFSKLAKTVSIFMRSDNPKAHPTLVERAKERDIKIVSLRGDNMKTPAKGGSASGGKQSRNLLDRRARPKFIEWLARDDITTADLIIICIGKENKVPFFRDKKLPNGVFAAGDCIRPSHERYIPIAMADGMKAVSSIL